MPKSKREKLLHMSQVGKKTRDHKERLFSQIREALPDYQYCFVLRLDNVRNQHLRELRLQLKDSRLFLGKTKLMARALGTSPADAQADGIDRLASRYLAGGAVGLLLTNRAPSDLDDLLANASGEVDFARAGAAAPRDVVVPPGNVLSTAGSDTVDPADDVPIATALEPELRRLGMPTRLQAGKVVLEGSEGYVICREGQTLDSRQTRLLRLFSVCLSEFAVKPLAYWTAASGEVTELEAPPSSKTNKAQADPEDVPIDDAVVDA